MKNVGSGNRLRGLLKTLLWLVCSVLGVVAIIVVINRFDEAPTAEAASVLAETLPPPEKNLHIALYAMRSAEDGDLTTIGQKKWQQAYDRAKASDSTADTNLLAQPEWPTCKDFPRCNQEYLSSVDLDDLLQKHALGLKHYNAMRGFSEYGTPSANGRGMSMAVPDFGLAYSQLQRIELLRKFQRGESGTALERLASDIAYWRNLAIKADTLLPMVVAHVELERDYQLIAEVLAARPTLFLQAKNEWRTLMQPLPPAVFDYGPALRGETRLLGDFLLNLNADKGSMAKMPLNDSVDASTQEKLLLLGVKRQATVNALIKQKLALLDQLNPLSTSKLVATGAKTVSDFHRDCDQLFWTASFYFDNPIGKYLNCMAEGDHLKYMLRQRRTEAVRLGVVALAEMLEQDINWKDDKAVAARLAAMAPTASSPWNGKAAVFDAQNRMIKLEWPANEESARWQDVLIPVPTEK